MPLQSSAFNSANAMTPTSHPVSRRRFLSSTATAATATASALAIGAGLSNKPTRAATVPDAEKGHMKLSLAGYSFNKLLPRRGTEEDIFRAEMRLEDFVHFCAEQKLDGTELTGYYFPKDITTEYLVSLKVLTHRMGLDISGTAIGNDFCLPAGPKRDAELKMCREWIDYAAILGAPVIRIFAGKVPKGDSEKAAIARCIDGIQESLDYAAKKGVLLALENHGGITATPAQMIRIIEGVGDSPWFGVNFDSGNFRTDDPYRDLEIIAPMAINAQIKVNMHPAGKPKEPADLKRIVGILKNVGYRGYVVLEYEEQDPAKNIPGYLQQLRDLIAD